jgi:hypothetical protein
MLISIRSLDRQMKDAKKTDEIMDTDSSVFWLFTDSL